MGLSHVTCLYTTQKLYFCSCYKKWFSDRTDHLFVLFPAFMWAVVARRLLPTRKLCLCVPTCSSMVPVSAIASRCWTSEAGILEKRGQRSSLGRSLVPSTNHLGNISAAPSIPIWISLLNLVRRDNILLGAVCCLLMSSCGSLCL